MTEISQKKRLMIEYLLECQFGRYFEELKGTQTIGPVIAKKIETWENCDEDALALLCDAESGQIGRAHV